MQTGTLLSQTWVITRRYSWLWILGLFLTGMASGNVDITLPVSPDVTGASAAGLSIPAVMGVVFVAGVLAVLGVALWVAGAVARGALIAATDRLAADPDEEEPITLVPALELGFSYFGRIFLIGIPVAIPALLLTFLAYAGALASLSGSPESPRLNDILALLLVLCGVLVVMSLGLTLVQHFADRAAVLEDLPPLAAYRRGWHLLIRSWRELRGITALWMALTIGLRLLLAVPTTGLLLPVVFAGITGHPLGNPALTLVCMAGFLTVMVSLLFAVGNVFAGVLWTLVYRACMQAEAAAPDVTLEPSRLSNDSR